MLFVAVKVKFDQQLFFRKQALPQDGEWQIFKKKKMVQFESVRKNKQNRTMRTQMGKQDKTDSKTTKTKKTEQPPPRPHCQPQTQALPIWKPLVVNSLPSRWLTEGGMVNIDESIDGPLIKPSRGTWGSVVELTTNPSWDPVSAPT